MNSNNGGQKKIYVDADEEITTVVDHLRNTGAEHVIFVIPQHALLLQSIVNLKLLAMEAHRMRKKIMIMTNDEEGIVFAQKAGILTQAYASEGNTVAHINDTSVERPVAHRSSAHSANATPRSPQKNRSAAVVGSQTFHPQRNTGTSYANDDGIHRSAPSIKNSPHVHPQKKRSHISQTAQNLTQEPHRIRRGHTVQQMTYPDDDHETFSQYEKDLSHMYVAPDSTHGRSTDQPVFATPSRERHTHVKRSFDNTAKESKRKKRSSQSQNTPVSKKIQFFTKALIIIGVMSFLCVGLIAILPFSQIGVVPRQVDIDQKIDVTAQVDSENYDVDRRIIPARMIDRDVTFTKTFTATGSGDVDAQKAQGTITIINEFDQNPQPLVATTRFVAQNGALFRLAAATTVPGMKDGEPGKVDALVVADEPGETGNIGPTRFTIPGFDASAKRDKIYAVSESAMTGGGAGGDGVSIVTEDDIARAQKDMEGELSQYIEEQITAILRPDSEILLTEALQTEEIRSQASVSSDTMAQDFMYEIVTHVTAVVFAKEDIMAIMDDAIRADVPHAPDDMTVVTTYTNIQPDLGNGVIKMTVGGNAVFSADVNLDDFAQDITNVHHDEILSIIEKKYDDTIDKVVIESVVPGFPAFISTRVSRVPQMTTVRIVE
jgi:hypothetical protein